MNPELLYVPPTNCGTENVDLATVPLDCFFGPYWVREDTSDVLQVSALRRMIFRRPHDGMPTFLWRFCATGAALAALPWSDLGLRRGGRDPLSRPPQTRHSSLARTAAAASPRQITGFSVTDVDLTEEDTSAELDTFIDVLMGIVDLNTRTNLNFYDQNARNRRGFVAQQAPAPPRADWRGRSRWGPPGPGTGRKRRGQGGGREGDRWLGYGLRSAKSASRGWLLARSRRAARAAVDRVDGSRRALGGWAGCRC